MLPVALDIGDWTASAVGGSMLLAIPVALLAGLVAFFSPCVLPLLPGYLVYVSGLGAADVIETTTVNGQAARTGRPEAHRMRMFAGTSLFVAGIAVVFVSTGAVAGSLGSFVFGHSSLISRILGVLVVLLGLVYMGVLRIGQRDLRIHRVPAVGVAAAPLVGIVFALGWTPCIGPTLGAVLTLALNEGTALRGAFLAAVFALGMGVPFIAAGIAYSKTARSFGFLRRHQSGVQRIGGAMMVIVGVLLVSGLWARAMAGVRGWAAGFVPGI